MASGDGNTFQLKQSSTTEKHSSDHDARSEKDTLVKKEKSWAHNLEKDNRYRQTAIVISVISVILTLVMGVVSFVLGILSESVATFGFACGALLDSLTSSVVIWRYWGNSSIVYSWERERRSCIFLGVLFILTTLVIFAKSIVALIFQDKPRDDDLVWALSLTNGIACTLLAVTKFWLGTKLHSSAVKTDAFNSLIDAVMAFAVLISVTVYRDNPSIWYLDPIVGTCCAVFFLIYGIRLLMNHIPQKLPPEGEDFDQ